LPVTYEAIGAEKSCGGAVFPRRLIGNDENSAENTGIRDRDATPQTFIFFTLLDSAGACEIRLDEHRALAVLSHFDTQWLQGTVLPGKRELLVLVFETSKHSCRDE
jgi:hypothetical protein